LNGVAGAEIAVGYDQAVRTTGNILLLLELLLFLQLTVTANKKAELTTKRAKKELFWDFIDN
jgi:uncharacterized membrane protein